ncbi:related to transcriptional activator Mut3p [Fusarium torulosum]|uniref:Related to transcriptional activator Mut3p n=1 Tax=Fusarium torulosum TaxID=33205 RepID=A0AAE8SNA2_9HYPO|nr:related to transcriptional activator Mut3p [Fusarium torulosum]
MDHMGFQVPGMAPPVMNQPPQVFGGYDGLPQLPPEIAAQMFNDSAMMLEDANDPKRRRIARACDMCRKKKIKCDGKMPSCTHCINYKTECVFTQVEKKRAPPKGAKYIEGLENRLNRMEHLLRLSGLLDDEDGDLGALEKKLMDRQQKSRQPSMAVVSGPNSPSHSVPSAADGNVMTPQSSLTSPNSIAKDDKRKSTTPAPATTPSTAPGPATNGEEANPEDQVEVEALSEMMCSLVTNNFGETRYIGSSSGFSIFSPKGVSWVNGKTGDDSFQRTISEISVDDHKWTNWKPEVFGDLFQRPVFRPLPPKAEALSLLQDFFDNFNCIFPLFHQPTFMHLVQLQYSSDPYQGSGWWASLNIALAIAHRLRVMSNLVPQDEDDKAWGYLKNAIGVFPELTMRNTDLLSVQALLGMALFLQGTPNPQPTFLLVAAAMRLAQSIGLHKRGTGFNLNPIEIEQRKRVFWIAYMLDKDLCLRAGRPPAQDDDDMNVELPDADPADNIGNIPLADGKGKMNLFRVMCEFATIESEVYKRLYSVQATKQSDGELLNTIGELDHKLEEWKDSIPIDYRPEHDINASHTPLILHVVMLHLTYYNCLTTIHRMSVHHGFWTSRLANYAIQGLNARPLNPRVFSSAALCTAAARASVSLLKYVPQGDFACVWMILYFPVSALVTLFGNILQNPLDPRAKPDTRLMNIVVTFLSMLGQEAEQGGVHRMLGICAEFERIAKAVIDKAEKEQSSRRKRKNQDTANKSSSNTNIPAARHPPTADSTPSASMSSTAHRRPSQAQLSPPPNGDSRGSFSISTPMNDPSPSAMSAGWPQEFPVPQPHQNGDFDSMNYGDGNMHSSPQMPVSAFQQPLLPQDLFSLPMTLDWSWAEMTTGAYPTVENGNFGGAQM